MGMFKMEKPRRFNHQYIYVDERKEKLQKLEEKAKRELGMLPPKEFSPEDIRGKFVQGTKHLKRRKESGRKPMTYGALFVAILVLLYILQPLTGFLSTPLKDILFIKRTDIVKPHKVIQLHLLRRTLEHRIKSTVRFRTHNHFFHLPVFQKHIQQTGFRNIHSNQCTVAFHRIIYQTNRTDHIYFAHLTALKPSLHLFSCHLIMTLYCGITTSSCWERKS